MTFMRLQQRLWQWWRPNETQNVSTNEQTALKHNNTEYPIDVTRPEWPLHLFETVLKAWHAEKPDDNGRQY